MILKTLKKIIERKSTIPILSQIAVKNGTAFSTDMDFYISTNVGPLEDGMYFAHGFEKNIRVKTSLPVTDWPELKAFGKPVIKAKLSSEHVAALEWTLKAASNEETRYYLMGVYFSNKQEIVATDGYRLHGFKIPLEFLNENTKGAIIPKKAVKAIIDAFKESKWPAADITIYDNNTFECVVKGGTISGKTIDGTYPDYSKVIPTKGEDTKTTIWKPQDLEKFKAELEIYAKITDAGRSKSVKVEKGMLILQSIGELKERKSWPISANIADGIGFNLAYLQQICGGIMHYKSPSDPVLIEDNRGLNRFCVLMPLRV